MYWSIKYLFILSPLYTLLEVTDKCTRTLLDQGHYYWDTKSNTIILAFSMAWLSAELFGKIVIHCGKRTLFPPFASTNCRLLILYNTHTTNRSLIINLMDQFVKQYKSVVFSRSSLSCVILCLLSRITKTCEDM